MAEKETGKESNEKKKSSAIPEFYKKTPAEALEVAKQFKLQPHTAFWDSSEGVFILRSGVDHFQADEAQAFTLTHSPSPAPKDTTRPLF